jgi:long-chain acyl-CoA synthetase
MNNPDFQKLDLSAGAGPWRRHGGAAAGRRTLAGDDRCAITEGYGLSETSPVATANRFDVPEFTGTIGLPLPSTDIEIRDEDGNTLPLGEVGEICIRGPQVMAGYWQRPDETAKVMTPTVSSAPATWASWTRRAMVLPRSSTARRT